MQVGVQREDPSNVSENGRNSEHDRTIFAPGNQRKLRAEEQLLQMALHQPSMERQYHSFGDKLGIFKASVLRTVHEVVATVNRKILPQWVRWPRNVTEVMREFYDLGRMPLVCGCVDGTLIEVDAPSDNETNLVDRHGNHSISVMLVCVPDLCFCYMAVNWPGSVHDDRVLRNSRMY